VHVAIEEAQSMTAQALEKIGWDRDDAALQAEIMTAAELCGNNQGLVKMYQPHLMAPSPHYLGKPVVTRETLNSAVIDAQQSPGMLAAVTAVDVAVQKLRDQPDLAVSVVTAHNSSTSSGQLAFYAERVARQGFVAVLACNSPELVSPAPGARPVFGTNPLAVGIPLQDSPYPFTVRTYWCFCDG
jgi:LDH2 family malate/lactate/ureidoglycolate dehydrogenase